MGWRFGHGGKDRNWAGAGIRVEMGVVEMEASPPFLSHYQLIVNFVN